MTEWSLHIVLNHIKEIKLVPVGKHIIVRLTKNIPHVPLPQVGNQHGKMMLVIGSPDSSLGSLGTVIKPLFQILHPTYPRSSSSSFHILSFLVFLLSSCVRNSI
uniref:Uncharacterized protein n=1 Tax=Cacopsylla melanoneura TaxID=428564 RepID=A0A8D8W5A5_9HEMI